MKFIKLSALRRELNEEAQKRLDDFEDSDEYDEPVDEHGRKASWYEDLGIDIPSDLKRGSDYLTFDLDEDYDKYIVEVLINIEDFSMSVDEAGDQGSVVYLKSGTSISCMENSEEIQQLIKEQSFWHKIQKCAKVIKRKVIK